ncbi:aspartate/glutamate racemase family protein [Chloroflexota bacterium]
MKIWSQSCTALSRDPVVSDYTQALKKHVKEIVRPDTVVDFHGVDAPIPGMTLSHTGTDVCGWQSVRNAIQAEREGYDAFIMGSTMDPGYYEIREMVDIPVVFISEASLHIAQMLGNKFAYLTINPMLVKRFMEVPKRYGCGERMVEGESVNISYAEDFSKMFKNPDPYIDIVTKAVEKIVDRSADIILPVPVPLSMFLAELGLKEVKGAKILDMLWCALKTAELMVDLKARGITRSKLGIYQAPPKEAMPAMQKLYQVKWDVD